MTDLTEPLARGEKAPEAKPRGNGGAARKRNAAEAKLLEFAELLFFAYRDFTRDPDAILKDFGFGRAHHRVLHFVNRHSGLRVADLLEILTITKQSLCRVLKQLIDKGYIVQQAGAPIAASGCCSPPTRAALWPSGWRRRNRCGWPRP